MAKRRKTEPDWYVEQKKRSQEARELMERRLIRDAELKAEREGREKA